MTSPQRANERACAEKERLSAAVQDASDDILALQTHRWTSVNGGCFGDLMYMDELLEKPIANGKRLGRPINHTFTDMGAKKTLDCCLRGLPPARVFRAAAILRYDPPRVSGPSCCRLCDRAQQPVSSWPG